QCAARRDELGRAAPRPPSRSGAVPTLATTAAGGRAGDDRLVASFRAQWVIIRRDVPARYLLHRKLVVGSRLDYHATYHSTRIVWKRSVLTSPPSPAFGHPSPLSWREVQRQERGEGTGVGGE